MKELLDDNLDPAVLGAVRAEKMRPEPPAAAKDRVRSRLLFSLGVASLADLPDTGASPRHGSTAVRAAARRVAVKAAVVGAAFVCGGIVGAVLHARLATPPRHSEPAVVEVASQIARAPAAAADSIDRGDLPEVAAPPVSRERGSAEQGLRAERALLDQARHAIRNGDAGACLVALQSHAHRFPAGRLSEERDALEVKALVALGRTHEARRRVARFEERYPGSLLLGSMKEAFGENE
jgi:hypothetical protein